METNYKGFNVEECEGLNYVPKAPKIQFYDPDDCDGRMFFANSIEEAKEIIDDHNLHTK